MRQKPLDFLINQLYPCIDWLFWPKAAKKTQESETENRLATLVFIVQKEGERDASKERFVRPDCRDRGEAG